MAQDFAADLEELRQLLAVAKRPRVQELLGLEISSLEKECENGPSEGHVVSKESSAEKSAETGASLSPAADEMDVEPVPVHGKGLAVQPLQKITKSVEPYYITLSSFGWDQETDRVNVYLSLEGASKEKIAIDVKAESFELRIHEVNGKNYRCGVGRLNKPVIPDSAVLTVKPKRIILTLKKAQKTSWSDIHYKEDKFKKPSANDKDPMAGIMDLMKNMYDEGDEETKRTIAKAWSEARSGKKPADMV